MGSNWKICVPKPDRDYRMVEHFDVAFVGSEPEPPGSGAGAEDGQAERIHTGAVRIRLFGKPLKHCGVDVEITSQKEPEDAHAELLQDLPAIATSFSTRLCGAGCGRKLWNRVCIGRTMREEWRQARKTDFMAEGIKPEAATRK